MKNTILKIGIILVAITIVVLGVFLVIAKTKKVKNPVATIVIEGYEKPIKIELDPQSAPNAVANFIKLANNGFYNDYKMTIAEKQLQADSSMEKAKLSNIKEYPESDFEYGIKADILSNGVKNYIKHKKGVITMPNESMGYYEDLVNTANSQFYILTEDVDSYNEIQAAFGKVIDGMDVLDKIAESRVEETNDENADATNEQAANTEQADSTEENSEEALKNQIVIKSITVDTFGVDYGLPEYINYTDLMNKFYSRYYSGN
ncbi:MAG: peptidylprolyl isomerase [Clostridia bacterium]|nr:peptidylprolyl isomerase [Clostridia bacterium]MBR4261223.1 peptidylprolyl isomerase [Clostridia bacterium]